MQALLPGFVRLALQTFRPSDKAWAAALVLAVRRSCAPRTLTCSELRWWLYISMQKILAGPLSAG
jgi:hypothetical protein